MSTTNTAFDNFVPYTNTQLSEEFNIEAKEVQQKIINFAKAGETTITAEQVGLEYFNEDLSDLVEMAFDNIGYDAYFNWDEDTYENNLLNISQY